MRSSHSAAAGTVFRPLVAVLSGLAFLALVLFGFIDPASAKGPESAIITGPGIDRPIELINNANTDLVVRLMEQTGLWFATGELPLSLERPAGELGPSYTVTWINFGPPGKSIEERSIRQEIYLDAENGPVIHTPAQESLQGWGPGVIGWFAAPSGLRDTLAELGVPVSAAAPSGDAAPSEPAAGTVWTLGLVGLALVAGLVGALGTRRIVRSKIVRV